MARWCSWNAEQRLVPLEAARYIAYSDDRPRAFHWSSCELAPVAHELFNGNAQPVDHREHTVDLHAAASARSRNRRRAHADFGGDLSPGHPKLAPFFVE